MTYAWFKLVDGREVYRKVTENVDRRSDLPTPMFVRDDMPAIEHPHNGREYTSKSAFRAVNKAHGYVEVGNDPQRFKTPPPATSDRKQIRASLEKARAKLNA